MDSSGDVNNLKRQASGHAQTRTVTHTLAVTHSYRHVTLCSLQGQTVPMCIVCLGSSPENMIELENETRRLETQGRAAEREKHHYFHEFAQQ